MSEQLTFTLARAGAKLRVSYRYENHTQAPVQVHEALLQQLDHKRWQPMPVQLWQRKGDTVLVTIGLPEPEGVAPRRGVYATVPPGGLVEGIRELPYPVAEYDGTPMTGVTKVALQLEAVAHEYGKTLTLQTAAGPVTIPDGPETRLVVAAAPQPLP